MTQSQQPAPPVRHFTDGVSLPELVRFLREGVYIMDAEGQVLDANPVARDLLGVPAARGGGHPVQDVSRPPELWRAELDALARDGAVREFTREMRQPDGTTRTVLDTCYARNDDGVITFHGIVIDVSVTPMHANAGQPDVHARDPETGAYTADYLDLLDAQRAAQADAPMGICVLHVDGGVSPATGEHGVARTAEHRLSLDSRLERMTRFALRHIRATESVVRLGADQLVIVLPEADERATEIIGRRLQLAALRSAPCAFRLGWAARRAGEVVHATVGRALREAVPVRVVERNFDTARQR